MSTIRLKNAASLILPYDDNFEVSDQIKRFLTYTDRGVQYQLKKMSQNYRWQHSDPDGFMARKAELKEDSVKSLVYRDPISLEPLTYSGLWKDLETRFGLKLERTYADLSKMPTIPWNVKPFDMRYYQKEAVEALLTAQHGAISLPTGSGKSLVIINLCKECPVQTTIVTPSKQITNQLYDDFVAAFGLKRVGKYGSGKNEIGKLFTVCTGQALVRLEKGTPEYDFFFKSKMLIWDESHTTPAETFEQVCMGPLIDTPLRFFVSATQLRTDGSQMKLKGITGPVVYTKEFTELVEEGFLARPSFKIINVSVNGYSGYGDINKEESQHLFLNPNVNKVAADLAFKMISLQDKPTVILIDNFQQFMHLRNYITIPFEFVHGGSSNRVNKDKVALRDFLPEEYWKPDVEGAIERFNNGQTKLLIGTSAISTGVDLKPTGCLIYLQGGMSEVKVRQAIGRGTRVTDTKNAVTIFDFNIRGSNSLERHLAARQEIYETMGQVTHYDLS
jgi:superfamily II DNA or RNA helicase